jgi:hypothetical protein
MQYANACIKRLAINSLHVIKHLLVDTALTNAMCAVHATFHSGLMTLSFGCDMVINIPLIADLTFIRNNCQRLIDEHAIHINACHHSYDYQPGQDIQTR